MTKHKDLSLHVLELALANGFEPIGETTEDDVVDASIEFDNEVHIQVGTYYYTVGRFFEKEQAFLFWPVRLVRDRNVEQNIIADLREAFSEGTCDEVEALCMNTFKTRP